jgi:hypothetical protein
LSTRQPTSPLQGCFASGMLSLPPSASSEDRVAFVLHDMFDLPLDEIAPIVGRTRTRQLASRARRRVQGATPAGDAGRSRQRQIVDAFLAASRGGDFNALLALLDPEVVLRADQAAVQAGASSEVRGDWSGRPVDGRGWSLALPSTRGRSWQSTWSPTPSSFESSTW